MNCELELAKIYAHYSLDPKTVPKYTELPLHQKMQVTLQFIYIIKELEKEGIFFPTKEARRIKK